MQTHRARQRAAAAPMRAGYTQLSTMSPPGAPNMRATENAAYAPTQAIAPARRRRRRASALGVGLISGLSVGLDRPLKSFHPISVCLDQTAMSPWRRRRRIRDRALAFQHRLEDRLAGRTEPCQGGVAIFRPDLPRVFDLNFLRVEKKPARGAAALAAEADRLQGAAGLLHRKLVIDDEGVGEAMLDDFRELGWLVDRMLLMAHASPRAGPVEPPAELVDPAELLPSQELHIRNDPHDRSPEVLRQLLEAETARAQA